MVKRIQSEKPVRLFLAEWRERRGLSQEALAERIGTTKASISRWENFERDLTTNVLGAIAHALNVEPVQLFRHPNEANVDDMLASASTQLRRKAVAILTALLAEESGELRIPSLETKSKH